MRIFLTAQLILLAVVAGGCREWLKQPADVPAQNNAEAEAVRIAREQFNSAYMLVVEGEREQACEALERFIRDSLARQTSSHPYLDQAYFWLGDCRQEMQNAQEAMEAYHTVTELYPDSRYAAEALQRYWELRSETSSQ